MGLSHIVVEVVHSWLSVEKGQWLCHQCISNVALAYHRLGFLQALLEVEQRGAMIGQQLEPLYQVK